MTAPLTADQLHVYQARCDRVVDADTVDLTIDVGFRCSLQQRVRILGIDSPEMPTPQGVEARHRVLRLLIAVGEDGWPIISGWNLLVRTVKADSFGRYLGQVNTLDGRDLATVLLEEGHAVEWKRRQR